KAQNAQSKNLFAAEMVPVPVATGKESVEVSEDEEPKKARFDKIPTLKPAFEKDGTITAANASKINDGGAAVVLASDKAIGQLKPLARIVSWGYHSQDPKWFTTAPVAAIRSALESARLKIEDIDLFEVNEAFAVVTMAAMKELNIPAEKM